MKIEFRKVPFTEKKFSNDYNSVNLEGTFCKISSTLTKIDATLLGNTTVSCCRCGDEYTTKVDEKIDILVSDGVFNDPDAEDIVFETHNSVIDFDEICESEISSIKSDYFVCEVCESITDEIEKEY